MRTPTTPEPWNAASGYYQQASPGLRLFRLALGTVERLWPALAVRAARRLFVTPFPLKWLQRRTAPGAPWRAQRWRFEQAHVTVYTQEAAPHGDVALLVHGWGGHAGQMLPLAQRLAALGLRPVLLDLPGHGASPGSASSLPQFARAIDYVVARLQQDGYAVKVLAAHSLGASAAAYAASRGIGVARLVLLAPPASPRDYTRQFAQVFGLGEGTRERMQKLVEAREGVLMRQFEPNWVGARLRLPVLVVHDSDDRVNAVADGQAFAEAVPGAQLVQTQGLGHRRILKDETVLQAVGAFASAR